MKLPHLIGCLLTATMAVACAPAAEDDQAGSADNLTADDDKLARIREAVKDVEQEHVVLAKDVDAPSDTAGSGAKSKSGALSGIDWYQKWAGGQTADHDWPNGSQAGQRCMWASIARYEAIMKDAPPELTAFLADYTKWNGAFYDRNDDYAGTSANGSPAYGDAHGARLWAWRSGLSKWISQTAKDGSCYLPTRTMVVAFVTACKQQVASNGGEMQGCETSAGDE